MSRAEFLDIRSADEANVLEAELQVRVDGRADHILPHQRVIRLRYRSPRANAFAERWVDTARRELLDHLLIFGCRHLEHVLREFVEHYYSARPHQGLEQRTPRSRPPPLSRAPARWSAAIGWVA